MTIDNELIDGSYCHFCLVERHSTNRWAMQILQESRYEHRRL